MGKRAPSAPDPIQTAGAQAAANRSTAITQQNINMVDQKNPWGSVSYTPNGSRQHFDEMSGKWITTPSFSQTTTLSPAQQKIFDLTQQSQTNLAGLATDQSARLRDYLSKPFTFNNQDAANWAYDLGAKRLDPRFAQDEASLRTTLKNKGIQEGSEAWNSEMTRLTQAKNDAYNQLMLNGRSQAFSEALTQRQEPINEITGLMSGSQIANPARMSSATPQSGVANVDYTGLVNQKYKSQMDTYQGAMGGLFGMGTAGLNLFKLSDRRLKTDIRKVGQSDGGTPIYCYRYKDGGPAQFGVMAQDIEKTQPSAVATHPSGFKMVDYSKVR